MLALRTLPTPPVTAAAPVPVKAPFEIRLQVRADAEVARVPVPVPVPVPAPAPAPVPVPVPAPETVLRSPSQPAARWSSMRVVAVLPTPLGLASAIERPAAAPTGPTTVSATASATATVTVSATDSAPAPTPTPTPVPNPPGTITIDLPCPSCVGRELRHDLADWLKDPDAFARAHPGGTGGTLGVPTQAPVMPNPSDGPAPTAHYQAMIFIPILRGHGDLDGGAPPSQAKKAAFLDTTRDERSLRAAGAHDRALAGAVLALPRRLADVWNDGQLTAQDRRRLLFELWDECDEDDDGAAARATILDFVRTHLACGHADGYTDAELVELNRGRHARSPFQPCQ